MEEFSKQLPSAFDGLSDGLDYAPDKKKPLKSGA